ncbi:MAG: hypothetical protein IPK85_16465 [Gemmatimonadetes bacterium]|nr:hypothetical protein [Gemmatimonadota bacterium]
MIGFPQAVLAGAVDYAGLFPPAGLSMPEVVANYAVYRSGAERWALGRLVVPAARLAECLEWAGPHLRDGDPWRIAALVPDSPALSALGPFNAVHGHRMLVDAAEVRVAGPADVDALAAVAHPDLAVFVELAVDEQLPACLSRVKAAGWSAKIRMGGIVASAIPSIDDVVRFMRACHDANVTFKATAGLHHPLRGEYPLTYAANAPRATMHGYLNVFAAAGLLARGGTDDELRAVLATTVASGAPASMFGGGDQWDAVARASRAWLHGFGSCSFREPLDDLVALGLVA